MYLISILREQYAIFKKPRHLRFFSFSSSKFYIKPFQSASDEVSAYTKSGKLPVKPNFP